jgi:hypothetical protein
VARKFCGEKGILEIVKGFLNKRLWKHCLHLQTGRNFSTILEVLYVVYIIITSVHQKIWISRIKLFILSLTASSRIKVLTSALFPNAFNSYTKFS